MLNADTLAAAMLTLVDLMKVDVRFSEYWDGLVNWSDIQTAAGDTDIPQDLVVVQCLKKFCADGQNYNA